MSSSSQSILPTVNDSKVKPIATADKARGAKRAVKLRVLPDTPEPLTQSQILEEERHRVENDDVRNIGALAEEVSPAEDDFEVYKPIAQIPAGTARLDALKLTKKAIKLLPRVTAHCTASTYNFGNLLKFLKARKLTYQTDPRMLDDVIYTTYTYKNAPQRTRRPGSTNRSSRPRAPSPAMGDLLGLDESSTNTQDESLRNDREGRLWNSLGDSSHISDIFIFKYGTVVIWGMTEEEEERFLASLKRFEEDSLVSKEIQVEDLHFYYASYSRIFNDVITLRKGSSYMTKLSLSHALAQSAKISLFEDRIAATIQETKNIPDMIASTGAITMPHDEILKHIGQVFLLRMSVNHVGSILDSPEIFWKYPDLSPLYEAAREYLELPQRLEILNSRVDVLQDMLKLLKESVTSRHSERLEQIVIALIAVEIILGLMTIAVDLFSPGYD